MLACIDASTREGKRDMLVVSLFAHYGMRRGDVAKLEFGGIDWTAGHIDIVQDKTGTPPALPHISAAAGSSCSIGGSGMHMERALLRCTIC